MQTEERLLTDSFGSIILVSTSTSICQAPPTVAPGSSPRKTDIFTKRSSWVDPLPIRIHSICYPPILAYLQVCFTHRPGSCSKAQTVFSSLWKSQCPATVAYLWNPGWMSDCQKTMVAMTESVLLECAGEGSVGVLYPACFALLYAKCCSFYVFWNRSVCVPSSLMEPRLQGCASAACIQWNSSLAVVLLALLH